MNIFFERDPTRDWAIRLAITNNFFNDFERSSTIRNVSNHLKFLNHDTTKARNDSRNQKALSKTGVTLQQKYLDSMEDQFLSVKKNELSPIYARKKMDIVTKSSVFFLSNRQKKFFPTTKIGSILEKKFEEFVFSSI